MTHFKSLRELTYQYVGETYCLVFFYAEERDRRFPRNTKGVSNLSRSLACYFLRRSRKLGLSMSHATSTVMGGKNVCKWRVVIWKNTVPKFFSTKKVGPFGMYHVLRYIRLSNHERKKNTFSVGGSDAGSYVFMSSKLRIPV